MYQYNLECECCFTTSDIDSFAPSGVNKYCKNCLEARDHKVINVKEIGECESCRDTYELDWEAPDEPYHGQEAECSECEATYYQDFGGMIYTTNEQAKKNFPQLKSL